MKGNQSIGRIFQESDRVRKNLAHRRSFIGVQRIKCLSTQKKQMTSFVEHGEKEDKTSLHILYRKFSP